VHVVRAIARVLEQGGLADSGLPTHNEGAASRIARRFEQRPDLGPLHVAPEEHVIIVALFGQPANFDERGDLPEATESVVDVTDAKRLLSFAEVVDATDD
jgi:hypothetical protein